MNEKTDKITDFGEKIGGARKDLAALDRMLRGEDIENWTAAEREQYVTKAQIFKRPDYQKMMDEGMPRLAAYFIKTVYDALPAKPPHKTEEGQKAFVNFLNYYKECLDRVKTTDDAAKFFDNAVKNSPYIERRYSGYAITAESHGCMSNKLFKAAQYSSFKLQQGISKRQFGYSEGEKLSKGYTFIHFTGDNVKLEKDMYYDTYSIVHRTANGRYFYKPTDEMSHPENWEKDTWVVMKPNRTVFGANFESKEAAMEAVVEFQKSSLKDKPEKETGKKEPTKKRFVPPQLEHIKRTGMDFRDGQDVTGENMLETFGLRGGEFGNWENQNDRQTNLNMAFEAFKDLAKALNMSDKDISLGGKLAMAWGARGSGSALAHFERADNVINLTKLRGAGSLAHEWGHALDCYIARVEYPNSVGMATENGAYRSSPVYEVMEAIKYTIKDGVRVQSQFYTDAMALDKNYSTAGNQKGSQGDGYWHSNVELFARAFATYVLDKLGSDRNDYLCGHAETAVPDFKNDRLIYTYPRGEERKAINKAFDHLIDHLKTRAILKDRVEEDNHKLIQEEYKDGSITVEEVKSATTNAIKLESSTSSTSSIDIDAEFVQMSLFDMLEQEQYQPKTASKGMRNPYELY